MERDLAGARLTQSDFARLAIACFRDIRFPASFDDWNRLVAAGTKMATDQGLPVSDIPIDVDDFVAWCHRVQVALCLDGLRAYLILIRRAEYVPGKLSKEAGQANAPSSGRDPDDSALKAVPTSAPLPRALHLPTLGL